MEQTRSEMDARRRQLTNDMRAVVDDAEALLRASVQGAGESYEQARSRLERSLGSAKAAILRMERAAGDRALAAGRAADDFVHEHPWQAIGVGAAVGALVGLLLARR